MKKIFRGFGSKDLIFWNETIAVIFFLLMLGSAILLVSNGLNEARVNVYNIGTIGGLLFSSVGFGLIVYLRRGNLRTAEERQVALATAIIGVVLIPAMAGAIDFAFWGVVTARHVVPSALVAAVLIIIVLSLAIFVYLLRLTSERSRECLDCIPWVGYK